MSIDFDSLTRKQVDDLSDKDPKILKQLGLDPLPVFKSSFANNEEAKEEFQKLRRLYMKQLVMGSIIEYQREQVFEKMKKIQDSHDILMPSEKPLKKSHKKSHKRNKPNNKSNNKPNDESDNESSQNNSPLDKGKINGETTYQQFVESEMAKVKKENPNLRPMQYMALVGKAWQESINNTTTKDKSSKKDVLSNSDDNEQDLLTSKIVLPKVKPMSMTPTQKPKSDYQLFISEEIKRQRILHPNLQNKEYMSLAAMAWNEFKKKNAIKSKVSKNESSFDSESSSDSNQYVPTPKPKTDYQKFIAEEIKRQRILHPGIQNKDCMDAAAKEWTKLKKKNANKSKTAKSESSSKSISSDSISSSESKSLSDSESLDDEQLAPPQKDITPVTLYQKFISEEVNRQRILQPGLQKNVYLQRAAKQWVKDKAELVTEKK